MATSRCTRDRKRSKDGRCVKKFARNGKCSPGYTANRTTDHRGPCRPSPSPKSPKKSKKKSKKKSNKKTKKKTPKKTPKKKTAKKKTAKKKTAKKKTAKKAANECSERRIERTCGYDPHCKWWKKSKKCVRQNRKQTYYGPVGRYTRSKTGTASTVAAMQGAAIGTALASGLSPASVATAAAKSARSIADCMSSPPSDTQKTPRVDTASTRKKAIDVRPKLSKAEKKSIRKRGRKIKAQRLNSQRALTRDEKAKSLGGTWSKKPGGRPVIHKFIYT